MHLRETARNNWLKSVLENTFPSLSPLKGDASFRAYYRLQHANTAYILMDAPPDKESITSFVQLSEHLLKADIRAPKVYAADLQQGFALLEDFGDILFADALHQDACAHYHLALDALNHMQNKLRFAHLPLFDDALMMRELGLFQDWFLSQHLDLSLTQDELGLLNNTYALLMADIKSQPYVFVHRDYHSRNIMLLEEPSPTLGIIDFQDAVQGPLTYDLVSLLKDCYVAWPAPQQEAWLLYYYQHSQQAQAYDFSQIKRWFDWCGLQRHLKVLGIFCRLHLRDNKPHYLKDLPRVLSYVMSCLETYPELHAFYDFMQSKVTDKFAEAMV